MANFCNKCGAPLSGDVFCGKCGADTRVATGPQRQMVVAAPPSPPAPPVQTAPAKSSPLLKIGHCFAGDHLCWRRGGGRRDLLRGLPR